MKSYFNLFFSIWFGYRREHFFSNSFNLNLNTNFKSNFIGFHNPASFDYFWFNFVSTPSSFYVIKIRIKSIDYKYVTVFTVLIVCFPVDDLSCMKTWTNSRRKNCFFYFKDQIKIALKTKKKQKIQNLRGFRVCTETQSNHLKEL